MFAQSISSNYLVKLKELFFKGGVGYYKLALLSNWVCYQCQPDINRSRQPLPEVCTIPPFLVGHGDIAQI